MGKKSKVSQKDWETSISGLTPGENKLVYHVAFAVAESSRTAGKEYGDREGDAALGLRKRGHLFCSKTSRGISSHRIKES